LVEPTATARRLHRSWTLRRGGPITPRLPRSDAAPQKQESETMKLLMIIAASVASAGLVLPTVTQGQTSGASRQEASAETASASKLSA
jgi:hypothetical protein